ncbi:UNVERIFIED_ORG: hypothetical protein J3D58_004110 [Paenarthrobacter nicotinovorans]
MSVDMVLVEARDTSTYFPSSKLFADQIVSTPLRLDRDFADKEFEIHLLIKRNVHENDIVTIHDVSRKGARIGWCMPITALESSEHDFAENQHFLRYAFVAMAELFRKDLDDYYTQGLDPERSLSQFSDFLHPFTCVLVISKETLSGDEFVLDRYMPSLIAHGYAKLEDRHPDEMVWAVSSSENRRGALQLMPISADLGDPRLIVSLLHHAVTYERRSLFGFFYAYQIIELLMDSVFMAEQTAILAEYKASVVDISSAKDVIEKLQRISSEKKRLDLLIQDYSDCGAHLDDLRASCIDFLNGVGKSGDQEFKSFFYGTRNFIVHQMRDMLPHAEPLLRSVVSDFIAFIPRLLHSYKNRLFLPDSPQSRAG